MESSIVKFRQQVKRVAIQYSQIKRLKETMMKDHVVIHVDFAENYNCSSIEEVQSAYWNYTLPYFTTGTIPVPTNFSTNLSYSFQMIYYITHPPYHASSPNWYL